MEHSVPTGEPSDAQSSSSQTSNKSSFGSSSSASASSQTSSPKPAGSSSATPVGLSKSKGFQAPVPSSYHRHQIATMRPGLPLIPTPTRSIWNISICPTTGGQFQLCATPDETVDGLKKTIAKKLKLSKERITLLFKDRYVCVKAPHVAGYYMGYRKEFWSSLSPGGFLKFLWISFTPVVDVCLDVW